MPGLWSSLLPLERAGYATLARAPQERSLAGHPSHLGALELALEATDGNWTTQFSTPEARRRRTCSRY